MRGRLQTKNFTADFTDVDVRTEASLWPWYRRVVARVVWAFPPFRKAAEQRGCRSPFARLVIIAYVERFGEYAEREATQGANEDQGAEQ